jgi:hypothetical protein
MKIAYRIIVAFLLEKITSSLIDTEQEKIAANAQQQ